MVLALYRERHQREAGCEVGDGHQRRTDRLERSR